MAQLGLEGIEGRSFLGTSRSVEKGVQISLPAPFFLENSIVNLFNGLDLETSLNLER